MSSSSESEEEREFNDKDPSKIKKLRRTKCTTLFVWGGWKGRRNVIINDTLHQTEKKIAIISQFHANVGVSYSIMHSTLSGDKRNM